MAAAKGRNRRAAGVQYINGSAAPKLDRQVRREVERPGTAEPKRPVKRNPGHVVTVRRNQEKALQMNFPYVLALTAAAICTLYLCVSYLQLQSSISARLKKIESLEHQIETLKSNNDALETRINTSVDLDYVYKVATEELGMVYANKNQVRMYNKTESEYVRQYEDIPER